MIVAVCLNPALDVTYRVDSLRPGTSHRVRAVATRAGGKATNVVRVLGRLGVAARLIAPLGGPDGQDFRADAESHHLALVPVPISSSTRRTVTVVDSDATVFTEPGPELAPSEWLSVVGAVRAGLAAGDLLVLAGSVPPGAPADAYAQLTRVAHERGARALVDADGDQLAAALAARPDLVKPNVHEAGALLGRALAATADARAAAEELRARGAGAAVISRGAEGLVAATATGTWAARCDVRLAGNPTGAGDALTAALAAGLQAGTPWAELLSAAIATSAAAVVVDVAGDIDLPTRAEIEPGVVVTQL